MNTGILHVRICHVCDDALLNADITEANQISVDVTHSIYLMICVTNDYRITVLYHLGIKSGSRCGGKKYALVWTLTADRSRYFRPSCRVVPPVQFPYI